MEGCELSIFPWRASASPSNPYTLPRTPPQDFGGTLPQTPPQDFGGTKYPPEFQIAMRMGWVRKGYPYQVEFIAARRVNEEKYAVFVVHNGKDAVLYDDPNLFPSDQLITQLRLLLQ